MYKLEELPLECIGDDYQTMLRITYELWNIIKCRRDADFEGGKGMLPTHKQPWAEFLKHDLLLFIGGCEKEGIALKVKERCNKLRSLLQGNVESIDMYGDSGDEDTTDDKGATYTICRSLLEATLKAPEEINNEAVLMAQFVLVYLGKQSAGEGCSSHWIYGTEGYKEVDRDLRLFTKIFKPNVTNYAHPKDDQVSYKVPEKIKLDLQTQWR